AGAEQVWFGSEPIPVAQDGQLLLNYRGPGRSFPHVPAVDVLTGKVDPGRLSGKIVLVGVTATGVFDLRTTPLDAVYPGVELHATAVDNILRGDFLHQPNWTVLVEIASILLAAIVLGASLRRARGLYAALVAAVLAGAYLVVSQWLFVATGIPLGLVYPIL